MKRIVMSISVRITLLFYVNISTSPVNSTEQDRVCGCVYVCLCVGTCSLGCGWGGSPDMEGTVRGRHRVSSLTSGVPVGKLDRLPRHSSGGNLFPWT